MSLISAIQKRAQGESGLVLLDQAIFSGNTFVGTALLGRFLGIESFGIYSSIVLGIYLLMSMSNALIIQPMQVALHTFSDIKGYLGFNVWGQLCLGGIVLVLGLAAQLAGLGSWFSSYTYNFVLISILASTWLMHDFFRKLFLATQAIQKTIVIDCIMASIQLAGFIGLGVTNQLSLNAAIILSLLSFTLSSAVAMYLSGISLQKIKYSRVFFQYQKKEGGFLFLSAVLQWWSSNLFVVSSGLFLGAAALGAFRLVQSMFGVLNLILQTYENYVLPKAAKLFSESQTKSKIYLASIAKKGGLMFALVLTPLFIFSKIAIITFGGHQYASYSNVVQGMVLLYAIIYLGYSVRIPIRILNLNNAFFIGYLISFTFSLISFKYLLASFEISGAIAGLIINQLLMIGYWKYILFKNQSPL